MDCLFCKIVNNEEFAYKIYEDEVVSVFLDKYPLSKGHTLVVPKRHKRNILDADEIAAEIFKRIPFLARAIKRAVKADGIRIITNAEKAGGQIIFHFHIHIVPMYDGMSYLPRKEIRREEAEELVEVMKRSIEEELKNHKN
jgi:histidine triad (HIT) family protein